MRLDFGSAANLPPGFWRWPHFDPAKEWADRISGRIVVDTEFMDALEALRVELGFRFILTSAYRTPEHNLAVATTGERGPHTTGRAADIAVYGEWAYRLLAAAPRHGFTGLGIQQVGPLSSRFIHLDMLSAPDYPRPNVWTYASAA